jgi:hypothetical protein
VVSHPQATAFAAALSSLTLVTNGRKAAVHVPVNYVKRLVTAMTCVLAPWTYCTATANLVPLQCADTARRLARCPDYRAARDTRRSELYKSCLEIAASLSSSMSRAPGNFDLHELFGHRVVDSGFVKPYNWSRAVCARVCVWCLCLCPSLSLSLSLAASLSLSPLLRVSVSLSLCVSVSLYL